MWPWNPPTSWPTPPPSGCPAPPSSTSSPWTTQHSPPHHGSPLFGQPPSMTMPPDTTTPFSQSPPEHVFGHPTDLHLHWTNRQPMPTFPPEPNAPPTTSTAPHAPELWTHFAISNPPPTAPPSTCPLPHQGLHAGPPQPVRPGVYAGLPHAPPPPITSPLPGPKHLWALAVGTMGSWHPWGSVGDLANPRATMRFSTRITSQFELSTGTDEGDFSFIFLRTWRNLRLRWTSCPFHFFAYIVGFFLAFIDFFLFFKLATKEFPFTPHQTLLSRATEVFLHDRRIPHQNSIS